MKNIGITFEPNTEKYVYNKSEFKLGVILTDKGGNPLNDNKSYNYEVDLFEVIEKKDGYANVVA